MLRWLYLLFAVLLLSAPTLARAVEIPDQNSVDLIASGGKLYLADPTAGEKPPAPGDVAQFVATLTPAQDIDRLNGGSYWFHVRITNRTAIENWVFDPFDVVGDIFHVYAYSRNGLSHTQTGLLHPGPFGYYYGTKLAMAPNETVDVLVFIQSKCFGGTPRFELVTADTYDRKLSLHYGIILACFGALLVLAIYNGLIGIWIKDRSYLYYSAYLLATIVAWAGIFNVLSYWIGVSTTYSLPASFFLLLGFSSLYFIHFLELKIKYPELARFCYGFATLCLVIAMVPQLFPPGWYMAAHCVASLVWVSLALLAGFRRLRDGYKPARFFVLAFSVVAIGSGPSVFATVGVIDAIKNHYLITLLAQTIDMALLALALADRINVLRSEQADALRHAVATEHRAAEATRKANNKLQQALTLSENESEKKSEFLRMVSHELRTPLYSILAATEQWDDKADDFAKRDLVGYLTYGVSRLRTQVDNLVLFAETEADDVKPTEKAFHVRQLIERVLEKSHLPPSSPVRFELDYSAQLPVVCEGDSYLIEHLLRTVLDNAFKYTVHGVVRLKLDWNAEESRLNVRLTDTGCGMSSEQLKNVYEDFVQVSRGLNRSSEGLGLGLTICYRLSEILNADLQIESELGEGTQVSLVLPLKAVAKGLKLVGDAAVVAPPSTWRVLLVEDNDVNAAVITRVLTLLGYEVARVSNGQEAVETVIAENFHLILMDIQMPVMDGITAARWIRRRGIETPIVAISANSDMKVRRRCVEIGMSDFLVKPIAQADLQRVLVRLLLPTAGGGAD